MYMFNRNNIDFLGMKTYNRRLPVPQNIVQVDLFQDPEVPVTIT